VRKDRAAEFELRTSVGFEYDSNVTLAPIDEVIRDPKLGALDDERFTLAADMRWVGLRSGALRVEGGYSFFQSLHLRLDDFDLQTHRPEVDLEYQLGPVGLGFAAQYEFDLRSRSFDPFVHQWSLRPSAVLPEADFAELALYYRMRERAFSEDEFRALDGYNHAVGFEQGFWLGDRSRRVSLGYAFDSELLDDQYRVPSYDEGDPQPLPQRVKNAFARDGHEASVSTTAALPAGITATVTYAFRHEDYGSGSTFTADDGEAAKRNDDRHTVSFGLMRPLWANVWLGAGYFGAFNRSNDDTFSYDRHVGFVTVAMGY
jgi:hypothetical protein